MPFTVRDFQGLVRALERRAEWKAELRRLLLTEELLTLPQLVRDLVAAQRQTEAQLGALVAAQERVRAELAALQRRTEERFQQTEERFQRVEAQLEALVAAQERVRAELAALQRRTEERFQRVEAQLEALVAAQERVRAELAALQRRTEERFQQTEERFQRVEAQLEALVAAQRRVEERVARMDDRLGRLEGSDLERRYRERAPAYFQQLLSRIEVVESRELGALLDDAREAGRLAAEERGEILLADLVLRGRREQRPTYVLAEVSMVIDPEDVRRAASRARLLQQVVDAPVLPVVAGRRITPEALDEAVAAGVLRVLDGRTEEAGSPEA